MNRVGIKVDLDTGDLISSAGRAQRSIADLSSEMKKAEKEGRWDDYKDLALSRDRLQSRTSGFERDVKTLNTDPRFQTQTATGGTVFKIDSEYASLIKNQTEAIKKLTAEYEAAIQSGDVGKIKDLTPQIEKQQADFHKTVEDATAQPGARTAEAFAKTFSADRIVSAITSGVSSAVGYANHAGIVNRMGSGDVIGAEIEETRKQGDLVGGIAKTALTAIGGVAGFMLGGPAGAGVGAIAGGGIGDLIKSLGFDLGANLKETEEARAQQWEKQSPGAMELNAVLGKMGGSMEENTRNLRTSFDRAARAANDFGYSAEEGMETIKQAAAQGLNEGQSIGAARRIFDFERGTGADRGTLTSVETRMQRFGVSDPLGEAWRGNQASGMATGQYGEFLRSMQRIFEDGITKGFVRGAPEITKSLTFLSELSGGSELWKGEQGANRLMSMNSTLEQATNLSSVNDILAYRGAQSVLGGKGDYIEAMKVLERGLTPELFKSQMGMIETAEGANNRTGIIERMRSMYGLNYTVGSDLYDKYKNGNVPSEVELTALLKKFSTEPSDHSSNEEAMARDVKSIERMVAEIGMYYHDKKAPEIQTVMVRVQEELREVNNKEENPQVNRSPADQHREAQQAYIKALENGDSKAANQAYIDLEIAQMNALNPPEYKDPLVEETRMRGTVGRSTGKMFDEWFGGKEDKAAYKKVNTIFDSALSSGNVMDREAAVQFSGMLESIPKETLDKYNKDNTWNQLGNSGDIQAMLTLLRELIDATRENGNTRIVLE